MDILLEWIIFPGFWMLLEFLVYWSWMICVSIDVVSTSMWVLRVCRSKFVIKSIAWCVSYFFACFLKSYKMWPVLIDNIIKLRLDWTDVPLKMFDWYWFIGLFERYLRVIINRLNRIYRLVSIDIVLHNDKFRTALCFIMLFWLCWLSVRGTVGDIGSAFMLIWFVELLRFAAKG